MSTWEMLKFWFIKETMPVVIVLGLFVVVFGVAFVWFWVADVVTRVRRRKRVGPGE